MLTVENFHEIALEARGGLRDCLKMIELHAGDSQRAFLNPSIVITAVATWERIATDLVCASTQPDWRIEDAGVKGRHESTYPWPGSAGRTTTVVRPVQRLRCHVSSPDWDLDICAPACVTT
jgi:hypothetical protein